MNTYKNTDTYRDIIDTLSSASSTSEHSIDTVSSLSSTPPLSPNLLQNDAAMVDQNSTMESMRIEIQRLQSQLAEAQQPRMQYAFNLTPSQIMDRFNLIPSFTGDDINYRWRAFRTHVNAALTLCGTNNELKTFCVATLLSTKIAGKAACMLMEIQQQPTTWEAVDRFMDRKFKPRQTTCDLMQQARGLKVHNIRELCQQLTNIKLQINEIVNYENVPAQNLYTYDVELVKILKTKILSQYQLHVRDDMSLEEVDIMFSNIDAYNSSEAIKPQDKLLSYKSNDNQSKPYSTQNNRQHFEHNTSQNPQVHIPAPRNNFQQRNNGQFGSGSPRPSNQNDSNVNRRHDNQYPRQDAPNRNFSNNHNRNNSNTNHNSNSNQNTNQNSPMEIDTISRSGNDGNTDESNRNSGNHGGHNTQFDGEVNFPDQPQSNQNP